MSQPSIHPAIALIRQRFSANHFDPTHSLSDADIRELVALATRAPSAYHLQNWRFVAVRSPEPKQRLRQLAWNQPKVSEAAVTFIVCGQRPDAADLPTRLHPLVETGHLSSVQLAQLQTAAQSQYADARMARDEAIRSASLAAMTLMLAAEARGLASCAMVGFDAAGVAEAFHLGEGDIPALLVAVGQAATGNWPQKPRRPLAQVLEIL